MGNITKNPRMGMLAPLAGPFALPFMVGSRMLTGGWTWESGKETGHEQQKANVSAADIARGEQGGALHIGGKRGRTREGRKLSSFDISGLRIPGGSQ